MTRTLLVVPTGHGVGLTATCLGLVEALQQHGVNVGFYKPLGQPSMVGRRDRSTALVRLMTALRPPEPIPAEEVERRLSERAIEQLLEDVVAAGEPVMGQHDVVVVEGLVPGSGLVYSGRLNLALAKGLDADVLLVGRPRGRATSTISPRRWAIAARNYRAGEHDRVVGAIVNRVPDTSAPAVELLRAALAKQGLNLVGAVPFREELTWPRLRDIVAGLDVQVLNAGDQDRRVKDVIIAAQAVPGLLPLLARGPAGHRARRPARRDPVACVSPR